MSKTYCRLAGGRVVRYAAAFPLDSTAEISNDLIYIGVGVICKVDYKPYNGTTRLKFYRTNKRDKYNGKAKRK